MTQMLALQAQPLDGSDTHPIQHFANVVELLEVADDVFEWDREAAEPSITQATFMLRSELQRREAATQVDVGVGTRAGGQVQRLGIANRRTRR